jgi:hypothetical protein
MTGMEQVQRLEALLQKIQKNAGLLAKQRAEDSAVDDTASAAPAPASAAAGSVSAPATLASVHPAAPSTPPASYAPPQASAHPAARSVPPARERISTVPGPAGAEIAASAGNASQEIELLDAEMLDDEMLVTIPPGPPDEDSPLITSRGSFPVPTEPPPLLDEHEFDVASASDVVDEEFRQSVPPPIDEIEAPPISTEQERGDDLDGLGVSLGFGSQRAGAADGDDEESEARRTPPPESGPQVSLAPKESEAAAHEPIARHADGPTMEQLGGTIELDAPSSGDDLELAERVPSSPGAADDFEAELPSPEFSGGFSTALSSPPNAREELGAHDIAQRERSGRMTSGPVVARVTTAPPPSSGAEPLHPGSIVPRPAVVISAPAAVYEAPAARSKSALFLDRLDASLALGPSGD